MPKTGENKNENINQSSWLRPRFFAMIVETMHSVMNPIRRNGKRIHAMSFIE